MFDRKLLKFNKSQRLIFLITIQNRFHSLSNSIYLNNFSLFITRPTLWLPFIQPSLLSPRNWCHNQKVNNNSLRYVRDMDIYSGPATEAELSIISCPDESSSTYFLSSFCFCWLLCLFQMIILSLQSLQRIASFSIRYNGGPSTTSYK